MKPLNSHSNILMIAASEIDANLYYATRFLAPDPFVFIQLGKKKFLFMSDLEVDRAKSESCVDEVLSTSRLAKTYFEKHGKRPGTLDLIESFLKSKKVRDLLVPGNFPIEYADPLRQRGFVLTYKRDPFFEERTVKSPAEIKAITHAIRQVEIAVGCAIDALRKSSVKKGKLYWQGDVLTSERMKRIIDVALMERGCIAANSIVSCGEHAVDPHDRGTGPLYAGQSIIMDIFPRDSESRYYADFTRTVVKGKASEKLKRMYAAVHEGQNIAFRMLKAGVDGSSVHGAIQKRFDELGFKTGILNGRMQGFFHGTGHGLGLDIHEPPRVSLGKDILKAGHVVTVEPGLYYEGIGGVRLEDVVVITASGCRNLTRFPKFLEIR